MFDSELMKGMNFSFFQSSLHTRIIQKSLKRAIPCTLIMRFLFVCFQIARISLAGLSKRGICCLRDTGDLMAQRNMLKNKDSESRKTGDCLEILK